MTVGKLIALLKQFDPDKRVIMTWGVHVMEPMVRPFKDDGFFYNFTTMVEDGDVEIRKNGL